MSGTEFEKYVADLFQSKDFWALRIPKNERGAQPFDILAIRGNEVYAVDCKVCERKSFPLDRIEDNQWVSMDIMCGKTLATVGFVVYHKGDIYFISYDEVNRAVKLSIPLDDRHLWELT